MPHENARATIISCVTSLDNSNKKIATSLWLEFVCFSAYSTYILWYQGCVHCLYMGRANTIGLNSIVLLHRTRPSKEYHAFLTTLEIDQPTTTLVANKAKLLHVEQKNQQTMKERVQIPNDSKKAWSPLLIIVLHFTVPV